MRYIAEWTRRLCIGHDLYCGRNLRGTTWRNDWGLIGGELNNAGNQLIFTDKVEWRPFVDSMTAGFTTGAVIYGAFSATNAIFRETAANYISFPMGLAITSGLWQYLWYTGSRR
ncbi:MAG TPA: hypothetical protein DCS07_12370 [Bdellovibrionales bacterium]|nr:hypothetical protein [Bdellovibrionales bacterium]